MHKDGLCNIFGYWDQSFTVHHNRTFTVCPVSIKLNAMSSSSSSSILIWTLQWESNKRLGIDSKRTYIIIKNSDAKIQYFIKVSLSPKKRQVSRETRLHSVFRLIFSRSREYKNHHQAPANSYCHMIPPVSFENNDEN